MVGGVEKLLFDILTFFDKEKYDIKIVTVLGSGPLEDSFRELGIPIYFSGFSKSTPKRLPFKLYWILIAPFTLIRITLFLIKSKPDIVISSLFQGDVLGMIASKIVGVKKRIIIQHDVVKFRKVIYLIKKIFAFNFSTKIISVSDTVKDFLINYFKIDENKITTIHNGINYEYFKEGIKKIPDFNNPTIGIIGRLEDIKGQIYVLESLKILKERYNLSPNVLFAGDGSLRSYLDKYRIENNLNSVKFLGNISDVPDFLSKVDILIIPSKEEGFGLVVLEGMVSGKVIIASDIRAMHELIEDGKNGFFFESQNSSSLANVLLNVLSNKNIFEDLKNGSLIFSERNKMLFNIKEVSKRYQNLLLDLF